MPDACSGSVGGRGSPERVPKEGTVRRLWIIAVVLITALLAPTPALAIDEINTQRLRNAVTVSGILGHERIWKSVV